jgi:energy-coupling factor transporter transmembrane protein EcfT
MMTTTVTESLPLARVFHPASLLLFFGAGFFLVQAMPLSWLAIFVFVMFFVVWSVNKSLLFKTLRRSRWLFLTLFILFVWMTPGVLVGPAYLGLTVDGLQAALEHGLRLLSVLVVLVLLLTSLPRTRLVEGLYALMQPFACLGVNARQIATRLMLTLEMIGGDEKMRWRDFLGDDSVSGNDVYSKKYPLLILLLPRWRWMDSVLLMAATGLVLMTLCWG